MGNRKGQQNWKLEQKNKPILLPAFVTCCKKVLFRFVFLFTFVTTIFTEFDDLSMIIISDGTRKMLIKLGLL